jgi:hypothetical protein
LEFCKILKLIWVIYHTFTRVWGTKSIELKILRSYISIRQKLSFGQTLLCFNILWNKARYGGSKNFHTNFWVPKHNFTLNFKFPQSILSKNLINGVFINDRPFSRLQKGDSQNDFFFWLYKMVKQLFNLLVLSPYINEVIHS